MLLFRGAIITEGCSGMKGVAFVTVCAEGFVEKGFSGMLYSQFC